MCLSLLTIGSNAFARSECAIKCDETGDYYYKSCLEHVANREWPMGLMTWGEKFEPPEKGYPTQKYCFDYAKQMSRKCYTKCPDEIDEGFWSLGGFYKPYYDRDDVFDPDVKAAKEAAEDKEAKKDFDCLNRSEPMLAFCYDNFPEGDNREACLGKVYKWQVDCMYAD